MNQGYTSTYLGELADAFARKRRVAALDIGKGFDLIVGTRTGGIVACAIAAGVPLRDVDHDVGAAAGQLQDDGAADVAAGAGDEGDVIAKVSCGACIPRRLD